jgi:hypothetical protein
VLAVVVLHTKPEVVDAVRLADFALSTPPLPVLDTW